MQVYVVLLASGLFIACTGMVIYFTCRNKEYVHKARVKGIVTDSEERTVTTTDKKGNEVSGVNHLTYFTYEAEGKEYSTARYTLKRYMTGQEIDIRYNPEDVMDCLEASAEGSDPKAIYTALMLIGFVMMIVGLVMGGR